MICPECGKGRIEYEKGLPQSFEEPELPDVFFCPECNYEMDFEEFEKSLFYYAVAYRYGYINNHQYVVAVSNVKGDVVETAEKVHERRGGKYGVAVYQCNYNLDYMNMIQYAPSMRDEPAPMWSYHNHAVSSVGESVMDALNNYRPLPTWLFEQATEAIKQTEEPEEY